MYGPARTLSLVVKCQIFYPTASEEVRKLMALLTHTHFAAWVDRGEPLINPARMDRAGSNDSGFKTRSTSHELQGRDSVGDIAVHGSTSRVLLPTCHPTNSPLAGEPFVHVSPFTSWVS